MLACEHICVFVFWFLITRWLVTNPVNITMMLQNMYINVVVDEDLPMEMEEGRGSVNLTRMQTLGPSYEWMQAPDSCMSVASIPADNFFYSH